MIRKSSNVKTLLIFCCLIFFVLVFLVLDAGVGNNFRVDQEYKEVIDNNKKEDDETPKDAKDSIEVKGASVKEATSEVGIGYRENLLYTKSYYPDLYLNSEYVEETPAGNITHLSYTAQKSGISKVDLDSFSGQFIVFKWRGPVFKYGFSKLDEVPELEYVIVNDDLNRDDDLKVSTLIEVGDTNFIFFDFLYEGTELSIDFIDTLKSSGGSIQNDASNFNSGPKYSTLNIVKREQWADDSSINDPRLTTEGGRLVWNPVYYDVTKVVIHHTVTPNDGDPISMVRAVYNYHAYSNGWGDIGYNYLIDQNGVIYEGKLGGDEAKGYHAGGTGNPNSIGIALLGTFTDVSPTAQALDSLKKLIAEKGVIYSFNPQWKVNVFGHRDFMATACPGNSFYSILPSVVTEALNYKNSNFASLKNYVIGVENGFSTDYQDSVVVLGFENTPMLQDLKNIIPFYNDQPVAWTGIESYEIRGILVYLRINYICDEDFCQSSLNRMKTLVKVMGLNSGVSGSGLNHLITIAL